MRTAGVKSQQTVLNLNGGTVHAGPGAIRVTSNGLVAGVAPLPADEVRQEHDEHETRQSRSSYDGDQHVIYIQLAFFSWETQNPHNNNLKINKYIKCLYLIIFCSPAKARTCSKLLSSDTEGLHLHLEGVDGEIRGHAQSLHLTAHVGEPQGASQVVQALVLRHKELWSRG